MENVLAFAPDGEHVIVRTERRSLQLFDLASNRVNWEKPYPQSISGDVLAVRYADAGRFFVMAEGSARYRPGRYTVWAAESGAPLLTGGRPGGIEVRELGVKSEVDERDLAVSDDGELLGDALSIYDRASGRAVHTRKRPLDDLDFQPGGRALAAQIVAVDEKRTLVIGEQGGQWAELASFPGSASHAWAGPALAVSPPEGLVVWENGKGPRTIARWDGKPAALFPLRGPRALVVAATGSRFDLYDVARGTLVFGQAGVGQVWGAALRGDLSVLGVEQAKYECFTLEIELGSGKVRRKKALGPAGAVALWAPPDMAKRELFFAPLLLPAGKYADLKQDDRHLFVRTTD